METDLTNQTVALPGGRVVGYAEFGDPGGTPVMALHGIPASGLGYAVLDDAARRLGARIVAPDRPGIRRSGRRPGYSVLEAGADLGLLADALGIDRFAVLGWSGGGPYALGAAAAEPERLTRVVVVAGLAPPDWDGFATNINSLDRQLMALCRRAPAVARALLRPLGWAMRRKPELALRGMESELSPPDRAALEGAGPVAKDMTFVVESFRHGPAGVVDDYRALASPWGFDLATVTVPVVLWQGGADVSVPPACADELARRLPQVERRDFPGEGHLLPLSHADELVELAAS